MPIEQEARFVIDQSLQSKGWILDSRDKNRNVFFETAVKSKLSDRSIERLGTKRPDYTLFNKNRPLAIIEAKKVDVSNLEQAMEQARDYADRIGNIPFLLACNGNTVKTEHFEFKQPLRIDGHEVTEFLTLDDLLKFKRVKSNELYTVDEIVIKNRTDLIRIFSDLNKTLRGAGLRAGLERFTEFANFLFLKLLSERNGVGNNLWEDLRNSPDSSLVDFVNVTIVDKLRAEYGGDVIGKTMLTDPDEIRTIIDKLSGLQLTKVDEDIKGTAFEHFIEKTTDTQNDLGEYYTPRHIIRFMVKLLDPKFGESVFDPFCGTGGFLTESFKYISSKLNHARDNIEILHKKTVFGSELTTTSRIAKMNMILFGDGHSGVKRGDSIEQSIPETYDNILTNIPFALEINVKNMQIGGQKPENPDSACVRRCFDTLKNGGKMALVVPEGILVNKSSKTLLQFLLANSRVRMIIKLPRGVFRPYTDAKTSIIYLTDKKVKQTEWFYMVDVKNDGFDNQREPVPGINDLDSILFYFSNKIREESSKPITLKDSIIRVVEVKNVNNEAEFQLHRDWNKKLGQSYVRLEDIASLDKGEMITEKTAIPGEFPVIAGGRGTIKYYHNKSNFSNGITVSCSGAYSGYVWWHDGPVWSSDSIRIRSLDEKKFNSKFIYFCMKLKQDEIYSRQQGVGQPHIYKHHLIDFPIPNLPISSQNILLSNFEKLEIERKKICEKLEESEENIQKSILSEYE